MVYTKCTNVHMISYLKQTPVVYATLIASLTFLIGVGFLTYAINTLRAQDKTISVTGSAERIVESDSAKWSLSVTRSATAEDIRQSSTLLQADIQKVVNRLGTVGIPADSVERAPTETQVVCFNSQDMNYDRFGNRVCASGGSYVLSSRIVVNTDKAKEMNDISQRVTEYALAEGITITNSNVEFFYNKLSDLRVELLGEATKNAQARAVQIVESTNRALGPLQSASMGVFQVTARQSVDFSDYGTYDTSTYEKKVTAIVRTVFFIR